MRQEQQVRWPQGFWEGGLGGPGGALWLLGFPPLPPATCQGAILPVTVGLCHVPLWTALSPGLGPKSMRNAGGTATAVVLVTTTSPTGAAARDLLTRSPRPCQRTKSGPNERRDGAFYFFFSFLR